MDLIKCSKISCSHGTFITQILKFYYIDLYVDYICDMDSMRILFKSVFSIKIPQKQIFFYTKYTSSNEIFFKTKGIC